MEAFEVLAPHAEKNSDSLQFEPAMSGTGFNDIRESEAGPAGTVLP